MLLYSRCFSFGIGEGASSELINGMAREGGGHAQFIIGKERMQPKVRYNLKRFSCLFFALRIIEFNLVSCVFFFI